MHIPENYLSPATCAVLGAAMTPVWFVAVAKVRRHVPQEKLPLLGIAAALCRCRAARRVMRWAARS